MGKRTAAQKAADREVTRQKKQRQAAHRSRLKARWERKGLVIQLQREQAAAAVFGLTTGRGNQCRHTVDGVRCQAAALVGSYYCRAHVPKG